MKNTLPLTIGLLALTAACQAKDAPGQAVFKSQEATIGVDIQSSVYTYKLTNLGTERIVGFETGQSATYNFIVPEGWEKEVTGGIFKSYATRPVYGIEQNRTAEFSQRVSSKGAILGKKDAKIIFESGNATIIPDVWAPVVEPKSYIALVAGLILTVIVVQTLIVTRKFQTASSDVNDA